ncbi:aldo/keto reductase [Vibrio rarus]|uniref:aldo/keto reductase n=1 Tax=Vibrio rarus TaxID=413403 RepID=UPI0021C2C0AE|nr:aldo/keto reductase [Vibrio rarus]
MVQGYWRVADWDMTPQQRLSFLQQHIEMGVTTVDHADIYGNYECERLFGEAIALEKSIRQQIQIVSKCNIMLCGDKTPQRKINHYNSSKQHIIRSAENSLRNLQVEHLDVLLLHRADALMEADEVAEAFTQLKASGKVNHFGVSNFTPRGFELLQSRLDAPLVTNQVEINPLNFTVVDDGTLDLMQTLRIRPMAWSCLAGGAIFHNDNQQARRVRETLEDIRQEIGASSIDQVIYAWVRKLPCKPLPIIGSGNIERVKSAVQALQLTVSNEQWYRVWVAAKGHGVP